MQATEVEKLSASSTNHSTWIPESKSDWLPGNYKHITKLVPCRGSWICLKGLFLSTQVMLIKWQWLFYSLWFPTAGMRDWFCKYLQKNYLNKHTERPHNLFSVAIISQKGRKRLGDRKWFSWNCQGTGCWICSSNAARTVYVLVS